MADATGMSPDNDSQFHFNVIHWNDEPVVTTAQLAAFYEVKPKLLQDNYNRNIDRSEESTHMHILGVGYLKNFRHEASERGAVEIALQTKPLTLYGLCAAPLAITRCQAGEL